MKGSCPCGAPGFNLTGTPAALELCHCSRCRKASGSAFLSEFVFKAAECQWSVGNCSLKLTRHRCATHLRGIDGDSARYVARLSRPWIRESSAFRPGPSTMIPEFGRSVTFSSTSKPLGSRSPMRSTNLKGSHNIPQRRQYRDALGRPSSIGGTVREHAAVSDHERRVGDAINGYDNTNRTSHR